MSALDLIMRQPLIYRLWMAPFAEKKFCSHCCSQRHGADLPRSGRRLWPGTNAVHFSEADYLGIDLNPQYIRDAERRYSGSQRTPALPGSGRCHLRRSAQGNDSISFWSTAFFITWTIQPPAASSRTSSGSLTDDGHVHIIELILPHSFGSPVPGPASTPCGKFPRPLEHWRRMFDEFFETVHFFPFDVGAFDFCLWKMVYFKGKRRL